MPVGAPADGEPQPCGNPGEPPLDRGWVTWVANLEAVQPLLLELADLPLGAVVAEVCRDCDRADGVHEVRHLTQGRQRFLNVARPAATEIARERVVHVRAEAAFHQGDRKSVV